MSKISRPINEAVGKPCPWCKGRMTITQEERDGLLIPDRHRNPLYPTRDHVLPRRVLSDRSRSPIVIVCIRCNNDKGQRTIAQFRVWLNRRFDHRAVHVDAWIRANPEAQYPRPLKAASTEGVNDGGTEQGDVDREPGPGPGDQAAQQRLPGGEPPDRDV